MTGYNLITTYVFILVLALVLFKGFGYITLSWWIIFLPLYIMPAIFLALIVIGIIIVGIDSLTDIIKKRNG